MNNSAIVLSFIFLANNIASQQTIQTDTSSFLYAKNLQTKSPSEKLYPIHSDINYFEKPVSGNPVPFNLLVYHPSSGVRKKNNDKLNFRAYSANYFEVNNGRTGIISRIKHRFFLYDTIAQDLTSTKIEAAPLLRNERSGIWKKIGRGEIFIGGVELIGMAGLMLAPKEITKWESGWLKDAEHNIVRAFTNAPVWDKDDWQLNYIGHPIAGSYYFNAIRSQNASWFSSFLFATAQSCIWEYLIEGSAEKPSIQDLIVTPVAGSIIGEATHQVTMNMRRNGFNFIEKVFVVIFNPMFAVNNGFGPRFNPVRATK